MKINNGYYYHISEFKDEWHAGVAMKFKICNAYYFKGANEILLSSKKVGGESTDPIFYKEEFSKSNSLSKYLIQQQEVRIYRETGKIYQTLRIVNQNRLIDEFGREFDFRKWN